MFALILVCLIATKTLCDCRTRDLQSHNARDLQSHNTRDLQSNNVCFNSGMFDCNENIVIFKVIYSLPMLKTNGALPHQRANKPAIIAIAGIET